MCFVRYPLCLENSLQGNISQLDSSSYKQPLFIPELLEKKPAVPFILRVESSYLVKTHFAGASQMLNGHCRFFNLQQGAKESHKYERTC